MKVSTSARLISMALIGVVGGLAVHFNGVKTFQMSRDTFLAEQGARYDQYVTSHPRLLAGVISGLLMASALFGLYESLVFGVSRLLRTRNGDSSESS
jgi:hypothetical protein